MRPFRTVLAAVTAPLVALLAAVAVATAASATPSSGYHTVGTARLFDSRTAVRPDVVDGRVQPNVEYAIAVAGLGGVPNDATRASVRLTTTDALGLGELYVHDCGAFDPTDLVISEITFHPEAAMALPVLVGGGFCVTATSATALSIDVDGYESPAPGGAGYVQTVDVALLDRAGVAAGSTTVVNVAGALVPVGAIAVSVSLAVRAPSPLFVTAYACDQPRPLASQLPHDGRESGSLTTAIVPVSAAGTMCIYSQGASALNLSLHGYYAVGASPSAAGPLLLTSTPHRAPGFVAVTPERLFDTRDAASPVAGGTAHVLDLTGTVPPAATDVVLNVTVTAPVGAGFVTVYPCDADRPTASNLNYVAGDTVPNLVTVSVGAGQVCFFTSATAHLLADLAGWYELDGGDGLVSVAPSRLFDTRDAGGARRPAGSVYELDLSRTIGADASAVIMNVTVDDPLGAGFVTVWPCAAERPLASNLNYVARQTVPNLVTVAVGGDRRVCFYTSNSAHLLADLGGWYAASSDVGFIGRTPSRLFDTRDNASPLDDGEIVSYTFGPGASVGADAVVALAVNVTVAEPVRPGFITAFPCSADQPTASNVNYVVGQVVPNMTIVRVDDNDDVCFYAKSSTHLIADLAGYFTALPVLDLTPTT